MRLHLFDRRTATALALGATVALFAGAMAQCGPGSGAPPAGAADARSEPPPRPHVDASGSEAGATQGDGGYVCDPSAQSDWPGWQRVTGLGSNCCPVDVPVDTASALPALQWVPCANGAASCVELTHPWPVDNPPYVFETAMVSHDANGAPALLRFTRALSGFIFEDDLFDLRTGVAVGGVRIDGHALCDIAAMPAGTQATLFGTGGDMAAIYGAAGDPATLFRSPSFVQVVPAGLYSGVGTSYATPNLVAFDNPLMGIVARWSFGTTSYVQSHGPHPSLFLDLAEQSDVFMLTESGTNGYHQEYVLGADGSVTLLRSKDATQVSGFAADGARLFWSESSGAGAPTLDQPHVEVWSAPYTADPATLTATAAKVATLPVAYTPIYGAALQGVYTVAPSPYTTAYVVRLDGATQAVAAGPDRAFEQVFLASPVELWAIMKSTKGPIGVALVRYTLADW